MADRYICHRFPRLPLGVARYVGRKVLTLNNNYALIQIHFMFKKEPKTLRSQEPALSIEDLFPTPQLDTRPFVNAQSERINNRFDVNGDRIISSISEILDKTSINYFVRTTNQDFFHFKDEAICNSVLKTVREGFMEAYGKQEFYDPLDGDTLVGKYLDQAVLDSSEKEYLYALVEDYYKYLIEVAPYKIHSETKKKIGRHSVKSAQQHAQSALGVDDISMTPEIELYQG